MKKSFIVILVLGFAGLGMACSSRSRNSQKPSTQSDQTEIVTTKEPTPIVSYEDDDLWYTSVKGHIHPGALENNETREMVTGIWWNPKKGKGKVELVPALKKLAENGPYVDIHSNEPWESEYEGYGDCMWYLQIDCWYKVVEPLFLHYYFDPHFVYEGDLDQDGVPDFGILLTRHSNLCAYALLTIKDGHWVLLTEPFDVAYNLRASGKELAQTGDKKGEIKITRSGFDDDGLSTFMDAMIVDTVVVAKRIDIKDFL